MLKCTAVHYNCSHHTIFYEYLIGLASNIQRCMIWCQDLYDWWYSLKEQEFCQLASRQIRFLHFLFFFCSPTSKDHMSEPLPSVASVVVILIINNLKKFSPLTLLDWLDSNLVWMFLQVSCLEMMWRFFYPSTNMATVTKILTIVVWFNFFCLYFTNCNR